jgi:hypothetical protein
MNDCQHRIAVSILPFLMLFGVLNQPLPYILDTEYWILEPFIGSSSAHVLL